MSAPQRAPAPNGGATQQQQPQQRPQPMQQQQQQQQQGAPRPQGAPNGAPRPGGPQQQGQQQQRPQGQPGPQQPRPQGAGPQQQQQQQQQMRPGMGAPPMQRTQSGGAPPGPAGAAAPPPQVQRQMTANSMTVGPNSGLRRGTPSPSSFSRSSSNNSLSSLRDAEPSRGPAPVEMVDGVPLVAEVYENQRCYPMVGWSSKLMDRPNFSNDEGTEAKNMADFKVPPGWAWQGEWAIEIVEDARELVRPGQTLTDKDGWVYATDFPSAGSGRPFRGSADSTLKAVRRRRYFRRRIPPTKSSSRGMMMAQLAGAGSAASAATVGGYLRNPMATVAQNNLSVRVAASSMSMRQATAKPAGAGPSLAELYAKQTVEAPSQPTTTTAASSVVSPSSLAAAFASSPSPSPSSPPMTMTMSVTSPTATATTATTQDSSAAALMSPASANSINSSSSSSSSSMAAATATPSTGAGAGTPSGFAPQSPIGGGGVVGGAGTGSTGGSSTFDINSTSDSPTLKPKYKPFSSMGMDGGLESLSAGFGGFNFGAGGAAGGGMGMGAGGAGAGGKFSRSSASAAPEKVLVRLWEHQRYYPMVGWSDKMLPTDKGGRRGGWINDAEGKACEPKDSFQPGAGWTWSEAMPQWNAQVVEGGTDAEGWSYAVEPSMQYHARKGIEHFVRRRLWLREKVQRSALNTGGPRGGGRKSYSIFFERLELLKQDLKAEENNDDLVSMMSATW